MSYLYDYLMFLAQAATIVVAIVVVITAMISAGMRQQVGDEKGHLSVSRLNDRLRNLRRTLEGSILPPEAAKKHHKQEAKKEHKERKAEAAKLKDEIKREPDKVPAASGDRARAYVLRFDGDMRASDVEFLRLEVTAVLTLAVPEDEVVVCVESPGGMVHGYGLAASQLTRIRSHGIPLTTVVDKVAASGGYMMAAVADKVVAAPFALVGSIGVLAQIPNVHRWLKKNDVDVEVLTAGKYKRTLTMLGENTDEGRQKFMEELDDVHKLFQEFIAQNRPAVDLEQVATGEAWYGTRALDLKLVDQLATSDEYLTQLCETRDVYEVKWVKHEKPIDRLFGKVHGLLDQAAQTMGAWRG